MISTIIGETTTNHAKRFRKPQSKWSWGPCKIFGHLRAKIQLDIQTNKIDICKESQINVNKSEYFNCFINAANNNWDFFPDHYHYILQDKECWSTKTWTVSFWKVVKSTRVTIFVTFNNSVAITKGANNILKIIIIDHIKKEAPLSNFWNRYRDFCHTKKSNPEYLYSWFFFPLMLSAS